MQTPQIERAHRDGPQMKDLPRHLLVKMLSFQDKRYVVSQQRKKLEKVKMYVIDDLTKKDREEKKRWLKEVNAAFQSGTRYHFSAGKWRQGRGTLAPFYTASTNAESSSPTSASTRGTDTSRGESSRRDSRNDKSSSSTNGNVRATPPTASPGEQILVDTPPRLDRIVTAQVHRDSEDDNMVSL